MGRKALLITPELCIGCRACQVACKSWNNLPAEKTKNNGTHENPPDLSGSTYVKIRFIEKEVKGEVKWLFVRRSCMHCGEPACVQVCPVGAMQKDPETGIVFYDKSICIGCQACRSACPFDVPRYDKEGKISKCYMCIDRVKAGLEPACAKTCPTGAIKFGERDELIAQAKAEGFKVLYGEKELGGLGVIFALNREPAYYNLVENPKVPEKVVALGEMLKILVAKGVPINNSIIKEFLG
ncbi:MAG: Fe-S-cluster-containing dehydrogenase component [Thermodesulfobacterium sp.]|uniref:Fe-S-cluster-containing dehydrogenase component n=1 Tax=Candidatus Thermodesulfobacterium syntrophicum TaxID=3060442 RepID=A0AAE3P565_9BACT|nr:Fe-S-cluster-containing dehydrogenase component [Candidatus Thermodesulfobacterium syntrophicum]